MIHACLTHYLLRTTPSYLTHFIQNNHDSLFTLLTPLLLGPFSAKKSLKKPLPPAAQRTYYSYILYEYRIAKFELFQAVLWIVLNVHIFQ